MKAEPPTLAADEFDAFVCICDDLLKRALTALYQSRHQRHLLHRIRRRTVRQLRSAEIKRAVCQVLSGSNADHDRALVANLNNGFGEGDQLSRLDAARAILGAWETLARTTPPYVRSLLARLDVLLAGGVGESSEFWADCPMRGLAPSRWTKSL